MTANDSPVNGGHVLYFSHGGGPLPILGEPSHAAMVEFLKTLPNRLAKPDAILVISAHWEEIAATVLGASHPAMFYDYYGFPTAAYDIAYPAPGSPELASAIIHLLGRHHIPGRIDNRRGFDHGLFIPLELMYPKADIPSIQLSLIQGLDPAAHIEMGRSLNALLDENVLVIGSGFSFHNMKAFSADGTTIADPANDSFQDWLIETCTAPLSQAEREQRLIAWETAPAAPYCHPREEHLLPLHVCVGIAGDKFRAKTIFDDYILGKRSVAFEWNADA